MRLTEERLAGLTILRMKDWDGFQAALLAGRRRNRATVPGGNDLLKDNYLNL